MMTILYVIGGIILFIIIVVAVASTEKSWTVVKHGTSRCNSGVLAVVTIEKNKISREMRAFMIVGEFKEPIDIEYARELIGHE